MGIVVVKRCWCHGRICLYCAKAERNDAAADPGSCLSLSSPLPSSLLPRATPPNRPPRNHRREAPSHPSLLASRPSTTTRAAPNPSARAHLFHHRTSRLPSQIVATLNRLETRSTSTIGSSPATSAACTATTPGSAPTAATPRTSAAAPLTRRRRRRAQTAPAPRPTRSASKAKSRPHRRRRPRLCPTPQRRTRSRL